MRSPPWGKNWGKESFPHLSYVRVWERCIAGATLSVTLSAKLPCTTRQHNFFTPNSVACFWSLHGKISHHRSHGAARSTGHCPSLRVESPGYYWPHAVRTSYPLDMARCPDRCSSNAGWSPDHNQSNSNIPRLLPYILQWRISWQHTVSCHSKIPIILHNDRYNHLPHSKSQASSHELMNSI